MSETVYSECPNCNAAIKSGMFNSNPIIDDERKINFYHKFTDKQTPVFCAKCDYVVSTEAKENWSKKFNQAKEAFTILLPNILVITLQNPLNWDYSVIKMVTAQSVTGTGVISEISSSISDFFGVQSNQLNSKLKNGENICRSELRLEAFRIGANAIIGTDIDYAEVGGDKGMLMVCMSGTAIKLNNPEVVNNETYENLQKLINADKIIKDLQQYQLLN